MGTNVEIIIRKGDRMLEVFDGGRKVKSYRIALGFAACGDKEVEGDGKTPEGEFHIFTKNEKSKFHLSLGLSYPNAEDAQRGLATELIDRAEHDAILEAAAGAKMPPQRTKLGGEIYIHGGGDDGDWTEGCIALKNEDIEELFQIAQAGMSVMIMP